jgi:hypothetical protein
VSEATIACTSNFCDADLLCADGSCMDLDAGSEL